MKVRIAIIGAGLIARDHAKCLAGINSAHPPVVWDPDTTRAESLAKEFSGEAADSLDAAVSACDLVWLCSPPFARLDAIRAACRHGVAIFCEKPIAVDAKSLTAIRGAVERAGVQFFMGQSGRFAAFGAKMHELVKDGVIGKPRSVWSIRQGWLDSTNTPPWRMDDRFGGGTLIELGIHEIDFLRWMAGDIADVAARASSSDDFQHTVSALGSFVSGATFRLDVSWATPRYLWQRGVEGEEGSLFFDDCKVREVHLQRPGKDPEIFSVENWMDEETGENTSLRNQARDVIARFRDGLAPSVGLDDGADNLKVALAIRKAAGTGRVQRVASKVEH